MGWGSKLHGVNATIIIFVVVLVVGGQMPKGVSLGVNHWREAGRELNEKTRTDQERPSLI